MKNERLGDFIREGLSSVAKKQGKTAQVIEVEIGQMLGLSEHTIQKYKQGNLPDPPDLAERIEAIAGYCLRHGRLSPDWAKALLKAAHHSNPDKFSGATKQTKEKIFVCYARDGESDLSLAVYLSQKLNEKYAVFFDQPRIFDKEVSQLRQALEEADWLILLLSAEAMTNEVVLAEMEMVYDLMAHGSLPRLLPVLAQFRQPLDEPFRTYLEPYNWATWEGIEDNEQLLDDLNATLSGGELPLDKDAKERYLQREALMLTAPRPTVYLPQMEMPEGTMRPTSQFYIERESDSIALRALERGGETVVLKGARQMGKSSAAMRCAERGKAAGRRIAFLDFQLMNLPADDPTRFFRQFCAVVGQKLGVENRLATFWDEGLAPAYICTEYMSNYLLEEMGQPVMLVMDEVDALFNAPFCTDFFAMLRVWHNMRASSSVFGQLDLLLITSTEPYFFIENLNQSPFNVGEVLKLEEFTSAQMAELNRRHNSPLSTAQLKQFGALVGGHPYLTRRGLYLVATGRLAASALLVQASEEQGPFGDHLRSLLLRLHQRPQLLQSLRQVLSEQQCSDPLARWRLLGAGLVREEKNQVQMRFPLYEQFFQERLS